MALVSRVEIRLLGEPKLLVNGQTVALRSARIPALLGFLATHDRQSASRAAIGEALWPGREPEMAGQNLRQTVARLRQGIGESADEVLAIGRYELRLRQEAVPTDVTAFQAAIARNSTEGLYAALDLYGGPFLAGFDDEWAMPIRADLARAHVQTLLELSDRQLASDLGQSLELAERAIALEPYHEGARARKIRALRAMGEEALALQAFEAYEALLADELGLRPTRTVEEALRGPSARPTLCLTEPDGSSADVALGTLLETGRKADALRLAVAMVPYWTEVGAYRTGLRWLDRTRGGALGEPLLSSRTALGVAALALRAGEVERALYEAGVAFEEGDDEVRAEALATTARAHLRRRAACAARRAALRALRYARRLPTIRSALHDAWYVVAAAHNYDGEVARARQSARRAQASAVDAPRAYAQAGILAAFACANLGDKAEARATVEDALAALESDRSPAAEGVRISAARLFDEFGDKARAEAGYLRAIKAYRRIGDSWCLPIGLTYLGDLRTAQGDPRAAIALHTEALAVRDGTDDRVGAATSLRGIGLAHLALGETRAARDALREAVRRFGEVEALPGVASSLIPLARVETEIGSRAIARRLAGWAVRLLRDMSPAVRTTIGPQSELLLPEALALFERLGD